MLVSLPSAERVEYPELDMLKWRLIRSHGVLFVFLRAPGHTCDAPGYRRCDAGVWRSECPTLGDASSWQGTAAQPRTSPSRDQAKKRRLTFLLRLGGGGHALEGVLVAGGLIH